MRNFRQIALGLVIVMTLSLFAFFGSVSADSYAFDMNELGITAGMNPELKKTEYVRRDEFAQMVVNMIGQQDVAKALENAVYFTDIENSQYKGAVNLLAQMGYIAGSGGGEFRPDEYLTYGAACKILVHALGYDKIVEDYSLNSYQYVAGTIKLTDNVDSSQAYMTFAQTMVMIDNALDIGFMVPTYYNANIAPSYQVDEYRTFRSLLYGRDGTGIVKMRGMVTADVSTYLYKEVPNMKDTQIQIEGKIYNYNGVAPIGFVGQVVDYYITREEFVEGMITAKNSDKSFRVGKTAISNITTFFRLNPNNGTVSSTSTLGQPYNVMTIPAEGLMAKGVNQGTYQITISGESALINAYSTWDVFPINYYLGESPDVAVKLYMKCYYNGGLVADFMQKEGTCVQINQNGIQRCELWAYAQNVNHQGNPVDTKIRADVDTNLNRKLDANTGSILGNAGSDPQGNKYWITNTGNYVHVKLRNVSTAETSIYAAAAHLSSDNGGYADVNWSNNYDESCFLFNSVDYGISETKFSVDRITNNATATTTNLTGTFNVTKFHDITVGNGSRQINVTYQLKNERTGATINCATVNPTTITSSGIDGTMQTYNFSIRCTIPAADKNRNDVLTLVVKINGGKTGTHAFSETTYDNNEDNATIRLMCQGSNCQPDDFYCDNRCVQSNTWSISR